MHTPYAPRLFEFLRIWFLALALVLGLAGCATLPEHLPRGAPGHALPPQPGGALADVENRLHAKLGATDSAWRVLDSNEDGVRWRLALIDSAQHTLDLQYYYWWEDETGELLMKHVIDAANRGVKVRIILDDLTTVLKDDRTLEVRDWQTAMLNAHPNIELRLFNAFRSRSVLGRGLDFLRRMDVLNQRMHNKLMVADNRAVILGGRNIGNEYFGFGKAFNFRDLDVLGLGPVARQASTVFDRFWNSEWVVPASALRTDATARDLRADMPRRLEALQGTPVLERFPLDRKDWSAELADFAQHASVGSSRVLTDLPAPNTVRHRMPAAMRDFMASAKSELLVANAYVIPDDNDLALFEELRSRGVKVRMLTNSLASQDVPAVNSHYKRWRKPLIKSGVDLYESRPDAAVGRTLADTPPAHAEFAGFHVKAVIVDRQRLFVGSMNLDPRSQELNSEMGVVIDSAPLARHVAELMDQDMQPANAWHVTLSERGDLRWTADGEPLTRQPARTAWQRAQDLLFMLFPRNLY